MRNRTWAAAATTALALVVAPGTASAAVSVSFSPDHVVTVASNGADPITVDCNGGNDEINGVTYIGAACADLNGVIVEGGPGANAITLSGMQASEFPEFADESTPVLIDGNGAGDTIRSSQMHDVVDGGSGQDDIEGRSGPDSLTGGADADDLDGELGADSLFGDAGDDILRTNDTGGPDTMHGGADPGRDALIISGTLCVDVVVGPDSIHTANGDVAFDGFEAATFNVGAAGPNFVDLTNAPFESVVNGTVQDETVWTGPFDDIVNLGAHDTGDTAGAKIDAPEIFAGPGGVSGAGVGNDSWSGVERLSLISPTVPPGTSTTPVDSVWNASMWQGTTRIQGGSGNDTLIGGSYNDSFGDAPDGAAETGDDIIVPGEGLATARGGPGFDTVRDSSAPNATVMPAGLLIDGDTTTLDSVEQISLTGTGGGDVFDMTGFSGTTVLDGAGGSDDLRGSPQADRITGGPGTETNLDGNGGVDTLAETLAAPGSASVSNGSVTGFPGAEPNSEFERVHLVGTAGDDQLDATGFSGAAIFEGGGGSDKLTGGLGADGLFGGAGPDTLLAKEGAVDQAIDCGADADSAETDGNDPTPVGCETVNGAPFVPPGSGGPGPGPGPGNLDKLAPAVKVTAGRVDRRGRVRLRFRCPANEIRCTGTFRLRAKKGKKTITVGHGKFAARGGKVASVRIRLTKAGRKLLRQRRKLKVTIAMTAVDAAGNSVATKPKLTLKPAAAPRRV